MEGLEHGTAVIDSALVKLAEYFGGATHDDVRLNLLEFLNDEGRLEEATADLLRGDPDEVPPDAVVRWMADHDLAGEFAGWVQDRIATLSDDQAETREQTPLGLALDDHDREILEIALRWYRDSRCKTVSGRSYNQSTWDHVTDLARRLGLNSLD